MSEGGARMDRWGTVSPEARLCSAKAEVHRRRLESRIQLAGFLRGGVGRGLRVLSASCVQGN